MTTPEEIDRRLEALGRHRFRASFRLRGRERGYVQLHGLDEVERHAHDLIVRRVAPASPHRDGRQTPYRGHPVFVAQHATATCCRGCLERWHGIPKGHDLSEEELGHVVAVIRRWIERELLDGAGRP